MSVPLPHTKEASPIKDVLIAALTMFAGALAIAVWQQRAEIRQLAPRPMAPLAPSVAWRTATARNFVLTPPNPAQAPSESSRLNDEAFDVATQPLARALRARPDKGSPLARLLENPEFFQALALHRQTTLDARFAGLFRRLDLGTDELANFKRLLAEKENVALDVVAVSEAQPDGPLPVETLRASVTAARAHVEDAIRDSLGSERYDVYRDYVQSLPQRAVVAQLEQRLSYSPTPLSPAQSESLVHILVVHAPPAPAADAPHPASVVVDTTTQAIAALTESHAPVALVNNDVLNEVQTLLTPHQVAALREIQTEQQASAHALQLIRDNLPNDRNAAAAAFGLLWQ